MMVDYSGEQAEIDSTGGIRLRFQLHNRTGETWAAGGPLSLGWQIFDPDNGLFITEGEWTKLDGDIAPNACGEIDLKIDLPPAHARYRVYVSPIDTDHGWFYLRNDPMLAVDAQPGMASVRKTTLRRLHRQNLWPALGRLFTEPFEDLWTNRSLIGSMVRRDILARYRGSFGDAFWAILHPLLLMVTYFFVFGVVLQTRFGRDQSHTGFALYFLAGMLPWLAFSEPATRSTFVILEHRVFVKKLVFPVSILPVIQASAGLVTSFLATALYLVALLIVKGGVPWTALGLPMLIVPQILFTLGICWFLAATGVFLRDLAQVIGLLLTLWFFLTPICYPETSLPTALAPILMKNPMFQFVRGYREMLLEATLPTWPALAKLWGISLLLFFGGYAWFGRLKRTFADVV